MKRQMIRKFELTLNQTLSATIMSVVACFLRDAWCLVRG
jgi:hypothetical protein